MFLKPKILFISLMIFLMIPSFIIPQAFSFTGPSTVVVPYGQNTAAATFYFTYYQMTGAVGPKLAIELDDELLIGAICSGGSTSYMPSYYTFNLSPGSHSIRFAMNSLGEGEPCGATYINWQTSETTVSCKFKVRSENIFSGGTIYVDNLTTQKNSPYDRTSYTGDNFQIGAIEQSYGGFDRIWNTSGTNNSKWQKQLYGDQNKSDYSANQNTTYTVQSNNKSAKLIAGLRARFNITRNDQSLEFGNTFNSANVEVIEGNPLSAPSPQTAGGITYTFVDWSDGVTDNPRTISTGTSPLTARYKALQKSNDATAFSNNSQRKLIQTVGGWLHQVYESMGRVWLEHSTNNGSTWFLGNNGRPLDNGEGKCPSIDWHYNTADPNNSNYNAVAIVYQQQFLGRS